MRPKGKRMLAWLLATTVTLSGNSFTVLADELDFTDVQEVHEEETTEEQAAQDENATAEIQIQDDFQSEEIEEPVVEEAEEPQIEETEESEITAEEVDEEIQEEPLFSAGEEENNQDPEEYKIWFENLRDDEYSTYFFDNENGELRLNTENLNGKNASISWEVGSRTNDPGGLGNDEFTTDTGLSEEMIFWSENAENNSVLEIDGAKLQEAIRWLSDNKGDEYWFEVRAYVNTEGNDEPVYQEQAGLYSREHVEDYHLPDDEVLLTDWNYWVGRYNYSCYVENEEYLNGGDIALELTDVSVVNAPEEEDETPVCEIELADEDGWNIRAKRFGTAIVTLTYKDISGEEQQHSFRIYVDGHKFILEPQWPASGNNMLKNSEMTISFVLHHDWKNSDEDQGSEDMTGWTLELDPDEGGYAYDTNLLDVEVHGEEHTITIRSKDNTWGTGIALRALHPSEDESEEPTYSYVNIPVQVCEEYDVLYPESIENINVNETLDLTQCGIKVEHIKENEEPYVRDDVTFDFEYDTNQWTNEASEDQFPILRRNTTDGTRVNVIARDGDGNEIGRREYWFDGLDYSVWFENMRQGEDSTYFFDGETGELQLNTESLKDKKNVSVEWEVGYRTDADENENDQFTLVPTSQKFWSEKKGDDSVLVINGTKLCKADKWLEENDRSEYWFEVRAHIKINGTEVFTCQSGLYGKENVEEYYINFGATLETVPGENVWLNQNLNCYVENPEHPYGELLQAKITKVKTLNKQIYSIAYLKNGWRMKAEKPGETKIEVTYTDIHGNQQKGFFNISVTDVFYWCNCIPENNSDSILANEEKRYDLSVYRRDAKHLDGEKVDSSEYEFELIEDSYDENAVEYVNIEGNTLTIKAKDVQDQEIFVGLRVVSKERDEEDNPLWSAETQIYAQAVKEYSAQIRLKEIIDTNPNVGETIDLNEHHPGIFKYNDETQEWEEIQDDENVRIRLEYDETVWEAVNEEAIPTLRRIAQGQSDIHLIAEERHIDRYGNEVWEKIAEENCYFPTVYDKDAECSHIWETVTDSNATCGKAGKRHQECTACQAKKTLSDIPATGKHKWGKYTVTKKATVFAQGQETRTCSVCKKKETRKTAKLKAALNLSAYAFPLQRGKTVTIKSSGLKNGDYVKLVSSAKSSVLKAVKLKNGNIRLTAQRSTSKKAVAVKVLVKTAGGASRTITVTVQSNQVTTKKITGIARSLSVKRGKTITLKPARYPFTSQEKITYTSSNKKIATVDANGRVKGIKTGSAVITVKSGKAVYKTTVKVTK